MYLSNYWSRLEVFVEQMQELVRDFENDDYNLLDSLES